MVRSLIDTAQLPGTLWFGSWIKPDILCCRPCREGAHQGDYPSHNPQTSVAVTAVSKTLYLLSATHLTCLDNTRNLPAYAGNRPSPKAGIAAVDSDTKLTADGLDLVFGTNFIGHFVLTTELMPLIQSTPTARYGHHAIIRIWYVSGNCVTGVRGCRHRFVGDYSAGLNRALFLLCSCAWAKSLAARTIRGFASGNHRF